MTDIDPLVALPVRVKGVEVQDPIVIVYGEGWGLTIACPWQGAVDGQAVSWADGDIEDRFWSLVGEELVAVLQGGDITEFKFSSSTLIAIPDTDMDPWVLALPGGLIVGRRT